VYGKRNTRLMSNVKISTRTKEKGDNGRRLRFFCVTGRLYLLTEYIRMWEMEDD